MASSFDRTGGGAYIPQNSSFARVGFPSLKPDLSTPDGLLKLAMQQGGAVSAAAYETAHPTTSILSSMGQGLKKAFSGFVDIISISSETVAGILSPSLTVREAIEKNIQPSDVLFGKMNPNASTLQKAGSYLVRTATNILLDPITYVSFGAVQGIFGITAAARVTLGAQAAAKAGVEVFEAVALNKRGQEIYNFLSKAVRESEGKTSYEIARTGDETIDLASDELKKLLGATIDAPLNKDFAKKALSNLFEKQPGLVHEVMDEGGIKLFGKSILSGQKISSTLRMVPGMTWLDDATKQTRLAVEGLFNPYVVKGAAGAADAAPRYYRLPSGIQDAIQDSMDFGGAFGDIRVRKLDDVVKAFDLSPTEGRFLTAAVENGLMPSDERLFGAFKYMLNYSDEDWAQLVSSGFLSKVVRLDRFVPHILVKTGVGSVAWKMPPSIKTGATELRKIANYTNEATGEVKIGHADELGLKPVVGGEETVFQDSSGAIFKRAVEPIHKIESQAQFDELEGTLLSNPKVAAQMLDDIRQVGFEGFDDNIVTAWAARSLKNTKAVTMKQLVKDLAEDFGIEASVGTKMGYVRVQSSALNDAGKSIVSALGKNNEEILFHPALASYVEKFSQSLLNDDATMGFIKAYDKVQNIWKSTVTSIWPAFHGRNALSNVLLNFMDIGLHALNPKLHTMSMNLMHKEYTINGLRRKSLGVGPEAEAARQQITEIESQVVFRDAPGNDWTFGELIQTVKNHNIAFTNRIVTSADIVKGPREISRALFGAEGVAEKGKRAIAAPFEFGQHVVGRGIENHARLINFIANLRATGDVTSAARRTKMFLFDYNHLSNFERTFMRRLFPFYKFSRANLEAQVRTLLSSPGRIAAEVHGIGTLGEVISGGQTLTDKERDALPDWVKTGINILTKKNGDQISMIANLGTPLEQPFQQMQMNVLLGSISPLLRLPIEQGAGVSFYQGKPLSEVTNAAAFQRSPKFLQDFIGFTKLEGKKSDGTPYTWYVSLRPERMNVILNLPPTTRVFSALKQIDAVDIDTQQKIIQQLTGIRPYSFDLVREQDKRDKEMMNKIEDLLTKAGVAAQVTKTFIPKATSGF